MRFFITGISSGIGKALALKLIREGHEVWGIARRLELLESLAGDLDSDKFRYSQCDISDQTQMTQVTQTMMADNFLPDVVILNAAVDIEDELPGIDTASAAKMMRINVDGATFWISVFIERFLERGSGQFIGVSSMFAHWPDGASVGYSASKAALSMLFRGCRIRYQDSDLQFKLIYLGPVDTAINPRFADQPPTDSLVVASAAGTADYIDRIVGSRRLNFYYPLYVLVVFTFLRWLPDALFEFLTKPFKR